MEPSVPDVAKCGCIDCFLCTGTACAQAEFCMAVYYSGYCGISGDQFYFTLLPYHTAGSNGYCAADFCVRDHGDLPDSMADHFAGAFGSCSDSGAYLSGRPYEKTGVSSTSCGL